MGRGVRATLLDDNAVALLASKRAWLLERGVRAMLLGDNAAG